MIKNKTPAENRRENLENLVRTGCKTAGIPFEPKMVDDLEKTRAYVRAIERRALEKLSAPEYRNRLRRYGSAGNENY